MQTEAFASCTEALAEWLCGRDLNLPTTGNDNPDPQESGPEEEYQEPESKEDKNIGYLSSALNIIATTEIHAAEEKLNSIFYLRILTPPPELG